MKKVLSVILTAVMLLSSLAVFAIPSSAVIDGEWTVLGGGRYENPDGEDDYDKVEYIPENYDYDDSIPMPGYEYTSDGFSVKPTDFTNWNPKVVITSKEKIDFSDGFEMEVRIDEFAWGGTKEDGTSAGKDHWISFSIWNYPRPAQGSNDSGNGWFCLIRDKKIIREVSLTNAEKGFDFGAGRPGMTTGTNIEPVEKDGYLYYTFKIEHNGDTYDIFVNGVKQNSATQDAVMAETFSDGMGYIGFTMQSSAQSTNARATITKVNGAKPTGEDSRDSGENTKVIAELADSSTVAKNTPCLIYDGTKQSYNRLGDQTNLEISLVEDDPRLPLHAVMTASTAQIHWGPKSSLSYKAEDFPYFTILFKNFCACPDRTEEDDECFESEAFTIWPYAGERTSADDMYILQGNYFDESIISGEDNYKYGIYDLSDEELWQGRINGVRLDFGSMPYQIAGRNSFDICFLAFFRSEEEAQAYIEAYIGTSLNGGDGEETTEDSNNNNTETTSTEDPVTTDKATEATTADVTEAGTTSSDPEGCKSVAGVGAVAIAVVTLGMGAVSFRKKKRK